MDFFEVCNVWWMVFSRLWPLVKLCLPQKVLLICFLSFTREYNGMRCWEKMSGHHSFQHWWVHWISFQGMCILFFLPARPNELILFCFFFLFTNCRSLRQIRVTLMRNGHQRGSLYLWLNKPAHRCQLNSRCCLQNLTLCPILFRITNFLINLDLRHACCLKNLAHLLNNLLVPYWINNIWLFYSNIQRSFHEWCEE